MAWDLAGLIEQSLNQIQMEKKRLIQMSMLVLAQLKNICANACSPGSKQKELETTVQWEACDVVAGTEMWWDESHNCSVRRARQSKMVGNVVFHIKGYY